ncbi:MULTISPECIES: LON peptidase substrate-binding domain-containing protein [Pseudomonas]|uniref:Peptidase S16 lon domain protein n=1 Tax=Pseudomonas putida (strain W619) TaxID=390235 RepID=B1J130_PSEPW|nr:MULTISPECIES: LON peptidase substrate-binding domain-containing protein [Pseudomonas]MDH1575134.1 LON peptidase substrate-binding domain-containing protein [Pseudomonas sp. GD03746]QQE84694.1 LON peptidase substrate-binding domain-containing protein [Pseudomonas putida]UTL81789.1 LON peptidase substrate-binding domain-containing protein [Pseudomonas putida]HEN8710353.1 LON peptidase substrate-binding domain-containing protein [Pseudomonas putida]HEN8715626.1 LON peptidase substrate-binding 
MTLPLFPLNTVLFPGCLLDLQIFEARYLDMIGRCMKQGTGFGVVCIVEGEQVGKAPPVVASIGCEALIRDFVQQDNGLLGIRVEGVRRFELSQTEVQKDQLLLGEVHWLAEQADSPLTDQDDDLLALLVALGEHPMVEALDMPRDVTGRQALANQLAYLLPFMEEDKLDLLAIDSPSERLAEIQRLLERIQGELFA